MKHMMILLENYFEKRKNMDFSDLPDLFGKD